jgi:hypothetical protein
LVVHLWVVKTIVGLDKLTTNFRRQGDLQMMVLEAGNGVLRNAAPAAPARVHMIETTRKVVGLDMVVVVAVAEEVAVEAGKDDEVRVLKLLHPGRRLHLECTPVVHLLITRVDLGRWMKRSTRTTAEGRMMVVG